MVNIGVLDYYVSVASAVSLGIKSEVGGEVIIIPKFVISSEAGPSPKSALALFAVVSY